MTLALVSLPVPLTNNTLEACVSSWTDIKPSILAFYACFLLHSDVSPPTHPGCSFLVSNHAPYIFKRLSASYLRRKLDLVRSWQFSKKRNKISKILSSFSVGSYGPSEMMSAN